jgi:hypothetical protein
MALPHVATKGVCIVRPDSADHANYRFLTMPGAQLHASLAEVHVGRAELRLFGNRAGILSLANILLWLVANSWRREFLSLAELSCVQLAGSLSVFIRLGDGAATGRHGSVVRLDRGELLEWSISEDDLRQVALLVHDLACDPAHEYDRLLMEDSSEFDVHLRMTDATAWLNAGVV